MLINALPPFLLFHVWVGRFRDNRKICLDLGLPGWMLWKLVLDVDIKLQEVDLVVDCPTA